MGIAVQCPNGHEFKVKDKYAGKKGLCPYCKGQVFVLVPDLLSSKDTATAIHRAAAADRKAAASAKSAGNSSSVLDDSVAQEGSSTSGSLMSSSVIRHNVKCKCGESVPMWFAKCPKCGVFMPTR